MDASEIRRRMARYYSQNGEDCFIWNLFDFQDGGLFIDVGAFDGKYLSNSYSFAENGWKVICVEPLAQYAALCRQNQPQSICVNAACVGSEELEAVTFASEPLGVYSRLEVKEGDLDELKALYEKRGYENPGFEYVEVAATTISRIVREHAAGMTIDVLSVDVEGNEIDVLKGADLTRNRPRLICAEANTEEARQALDEFLSGLGYVHLRQMSVNHFYSAEPALIEAAKNISIRCAIERQTHPRGIEYTFPGMLSGQIINEPAQQAQQRLNESLHQARQQLQQVQQQLQRSQLDADEKQNHLLQNIEQLEQALRTLHNDHARQKQLLDATRNALVDLVESNERAFLLGWLKRPGTSDDLAEPAASLRKLDGMMSDARLRPIPGRTRLCIAGFVRAQNEAFAADLARYSPALSQPNIVAHHARNTVLIKTCLRLGIPVVVVLGQPDVEIAAMRKQSGQSLKKCLQQWHRFHEKLLPLLGAITIVRAEDITEHSATIASTVLANTRTLLKTKPAPATSPVPTNSAAGKIDLSRAMRLYEKLTSGAHVLIPKHG
jgi:FkbM family methyltransferase